MAVLLGMVVNGIYITCAILGISETIGLSNIMGLWSYYIKKKYKKMRVPEFPSPGAYT